MASSSAVAKTTGSSESTRTVATSVRGATVTGSGRGAESQNVTSARAGVGANSWTPMSSRNFR
jgi:hypothetical protein